MSDLQSSVIVKSDLPPILIAEDDDGHAELVSRNFRRAGVMNSIIRTTDGQETIDRVCGSGEYEKDGPLKSFILLLDINMPKLSGPDVLKKIRSNTVTSTTPIIMLTTTDDPREIKRCYELGCNIYIVKPVAYNEFIDTLARLGRFLQVMAFPEDN